MSPRALLAFPLALMSFGALADVKDDPLVQEYASCFAYYTFVSAIMERNGNAAEAASFDKKSDVILDGAAEWIDMDDLLVPEFEQAMKEFTALTGDYIEKHSGTIRTNGLEQLHAQNAEICKALE